MKFVSDYGQIEFPVSGLKVELGGSANRMLFLKHDDQPDWTFFTTDQAIMTHPVFARDERMAGARRSVRRTKWLSRASAFTFLGTTVAIVLGLWWSKDPMAAAVATKIPVEMEEKIGDAAFSSHAPSSKLVTDEEILADFKKLSDPLIEAIDSQRYTFEFHILKDSSLNASPCQGAKWLSIPGYYLKPNLQRKFWGSWLTN